MWYPKDPVSRAPWHGCNLLIKIYLKPSYSLGYMLSMYLVKRESYRHTIAFSAECVPLVLIFCYFHTQSHSYVLGDAISEDTMLQNFYFGDKVIY